MVRYLTIQERQEIFRLYQTNSAREVARIFNDIHPDRPITHGAVLRIERKFNANGSLHDRKRSGRPSKRKNAAIIENVIAIVDENSRIPARVVAMILNISKKTVLNILRHQKYRPYKARRTHWMHENDGPRRLEFANTMLAMIEGDENVVSNILFTDESLFVLKHGFNRQNNR